jgi:hypothetical protein
VYGEAVATWLNLPPAGSTPMIAPRWSRVSKARRLHLVAVIW